MLLTAVRDKGSFHKKQLQLAVDVYSELSAYLRELMKQSPAYAS
jgi:hypothetical protein